MPHPVDAAHDDSDKDGLVKIELLTSDQSSSTNPVSQIDALSNLFHLMNFCRLNLISVFGVPHGETRDPDKSILGLPAPWDDDKKEGFYLLDLAQDQGKHFHYHFCSNYHHRSTLSSDITVVSKICLKISYLLHVAL